MTARLQRRITPLLAMVIVYLALVLVWMYADSSHFPEILAFAATLIGSITGYYFGGRNSQPAVSKQESEANKP